MKWTGRPPKFQDADALEKAIGEYFEECDREEKPYRVVGLAYALGISCSSLRDYKNALDDITILKQLDDSTRVELSLMVKRAYQMCENYAEEKMLDPKCSKTPVGYLFALKQFGKDFVDKQEIEQTNKTITVELED
ncbi:terminase small subunit [Clostridium botulinum]|uniref:terminase small subunit n=1 Tax=Clostridium botulinum TaxID=1491 RepID=UPI0014144EE2|nr:terminase small subunit [Clostridium botulinum]MBN1058560.1 hypothetical protein [Clostridium botulinum]NFL57796.1 hypothetical protein [Clostridium botulinum]NFL61045.1 hypothetical protein [Clostridium botulinum]